MSLIARAAALKLLLIAGICLLGWALLDKVLPWWFVTIGVVFAIVEATWQVFRENREEGVDFRTWLRDPSARDPYTALFDKADRLIAQDKTQPPDFDELARGLLGDEDERWLPRRRLMEQREAARPALLRAVAGDKFRRRGREESLEEVLSLLGPVQPEDTTPEAVIPSGSEFATHQHEGVRSAALTILLEAPEHSTRARLIELLSEAPYATGDDDDHLEQIASHLLKRIDSDLEAPATALMQSAAERPHEIGVLLACATGSDPKLIERLLRDDSSAAAGGTWLAFRNDRLPQNLHRAAAQSWYRSLAGDARWPPFDSPTPNEHRATGAFADAFAIEPSLKQTALTSLADAPDHTAELLPALDRAGARPDAQQLADLRAELERQILDAKNWVPGSLKEAYLEVRKLELDGEPNLKGILRRELDGDARLANSLGAWALEVHDLDPDAAVEKSRRDGAPRNGLTETQWTYSVTGYLDEWVSNGGLANLYFQTADEEFQCRITAFETIGATATVDVIRRADAIVGADETTMSNDDIEYDDDAFDQLSELDPESFALADDIERCRIRFAIDHPNEFQA